MRLFTKLFFPVGKVDSSYINFISWSFLSNICVSMETALCTDNMLYSLSSDSENVRTINYIGKDIIGQIGGLIYLSKIGNKIDQNPRKFLLYSDIIQQTSFITIASTPINPEYFLLLAGTSNILSNLSFTGYGAINTKCIEKLAIDNNIGEIYSKITMINMTGSSIGLILGLGLTISIPDPVTRLSIIPGIGLLRIYTYRKAINFLF